MALDPDAIQARAEAMVGQVLGGRYRLDAVLGMGAMGAVFRARHTGLERDVALKLLHQDLVASDEMRARFAREAAAISKLDHPNCVRVTDFGNDDAHQYLVMELLQGEPLGDRVDEEPLPPRQALEIVDEVLAGLEHAHGHGLIHRDIKPDNIFMAREESGRAKVKLLDFGIVKLQEQEGVPQLTKMGMVFGTPCYMSPEQAAGTAVDARTDLYAVGIILYMLLSGRLPFDSDDPLKVLRQQIRDLPPPLPDDVPAPVRELVGTLLAKKPDERYPSAAAAREAVARARQQLEGPPAPVVAAAPAPVVVEVPAAVASAEPVTASTASPVAPGPAIVVPSHARPWWPPPWWPLGLDVRWVAGGLGALVLVIILVVAAGGDEDPAEAPATDEKAAAATRDELAKLIQGGKEAAKGALEEGEASDDEEGEDPAPTREKAGGTSPRAGQASLDSVDALLAVRQIEAARIMLGPLLDAHPGDAQLHWRMARVLIALGGADNRAGAFEALAIAITNDPALLDDEAFTKELWALMDDAALRGDAVDLAVERLGTRADDRLLQWLNVQVKPLDRSARHRVIAHLEGHDRGDRINRPLQHALDLWQAREAEDPCEAFAGALKAATESPDSFLVGTLRSVAAPTTAKEGQAPQPCPGAAEQLAEVRARFDEMYAGIEPVVPKAYRKRPAPKSSQGNDRRRRR
jgi:hypothetical protein